MWRLKGRRLDLEGRLAQFREVEIDRVIGGGANRGGDTGEHREGGAVNVAGGDQLHARMAPDDRSEVARVKQVLAIHVPDAGLEWWVVQQH